MSDYDEKFMVTCQVCERKFKVINAFHLRMHELTVPEYLALYPDADLSRIQCEECPTIITDSRSVYRRYCETCSKEVRKRQNRERKRKELREQHRNLSKEDLDIIGDHHYPGLGTSEPSTWLNEIVVDGEPRVEGAMWLQEEMKKRGARSNLRRREEEVSDQGP